jgi:hypothetical protein
MRENFYQAQDYLVGAECRICGRVFSDTIHSTLCLGDGMHSSFAGNQDLEKSINSNFVCCGNRGNLKVIYSKLLRSITSFDPETAAVAKGNDE